MSLYLDLLEKTLLGLVYEDGSASPWTAPQFSLNNRTEGMDWPVQAHTMIGLKRLRNIRDLLEDVIANSVPGDFVETGCWRGGACIYARGVLKYYSINNRKVYACDSFEGLPKPDSRFPADNGDTHHTVKFLAVSKEEVQRNFQKYGLADDQVVLVKGWFKDTLPTLPVNNVAILRLDGDMYGSTMDALTALYHKVPSGGYIVVDDYNAVQGCKTAIHDFRASVGDTSPLIAIDSLGVYWKKQ